MEEYKIKSSKSNPPTKPKDSAESAPVIMQSTDPNIRDSKKLWPQNTAGGGDCAIHAIFGAWNDKCQLVLCPNVVDIRNTLAERIIALYETSPTLKNLVFVGIRELVMVGAGRLVGIHHANLQQDHELFQLSQHQLEPDLWENFLATLKRYPQVVKYIKKSEDAKSKSVEINYNEFYAALARAEGLLYGLIRSLPELDQAFKTYNELYNLEGIKIEDISMDHIREYAEFLKKPRTWLLPSEIGIIAEVFDRSIEYYPCPGSEMMPFNPAGSPKVIVQFNGVNHFEQLVSKELTETKGKFTGPSSLFVMGSELSKEGSKKNPPARAIIMICGNFTGDMFGVTGVAINHSHVDVLILKEITIVDDENECSTKKPQLFLRDTSSESFEAPKLLNFVKENTIRRCKSEYMEDLLKFSLGEEEAAKRVFTLAAPNITTTQSKIKEQINALETMFNPKDCQALREGQAFLEYMYRNARNAKGQSLTYEDPDVFNDEKAKKILKLIKPVEDSTKILAQQTRDKIVQGIRKRWIHIKLVAKYDSAYMSSKIPDKLTSRTLYLVVDNLEKKIKAPQTNFETTSEAEYTKFLQRLETSGISKAVPNKIVNKEHIAQIASLCSHPLTEGINNLLAFKLNGAFKERPTSTIFNKRYIVLWVRLSGGQGGAHPQLDMGTEGVRQIIKLAKKNGLGVILSGDVGTITANQRYSKEKVMPRNLKMISLGTIDGVVWDLREVWRQQVFLDLAKKFQIPSRILQFNIYDFLNQTTQGIFHIGMRSGNLEPYAYMGHCTHYIEDRGNLQHKRLEVYHSPLKLPMSRSKSASVSQKNSKRAGVPGSLSLNIPANKKIISSPPTSPTPIAQSGKVALNRLSVDYLSSRKAKYMQDEVKIAGKHDPKQPKPKRVKEKPAPWMRPDNPEQGRKIKQDELKKKAITLPEVETKGFLKIDLIRIDRLIRKAYSMDIRINGYGYSNWDDAEFFRIISSPVNPTSPSFANFSVEFDSFSVPQSELVASFLEGAEAASVHNANSSVSSTAPKPLAAENTSNVMPIVKAKTAQELSITSQKSASISNPAHSSSQFNYNFSSAPPNIAASPSTAPATPSVTPIASGSSVAMTPTEDESTSQSPVLQPHLQG